MALFLLYMLGCPTLLTGSSVLNPSTLWGVISTLAWHFSATCHFLFITFCRFSKKDLGKLLESPASESAQVIFRGFSFLIGAAGTYLGMAGGFGEAGWSIICTLSSKEIFLLEDFCTEFDFFSVGGLGLLADKDEEEGGGPTGGRLFCSPGSGLGGPRGLVTGEEW